MRSLSTKASVSSGQGAKGVMQVQDGGGRLCRGLGEGLIQPGHRDSGVLNLKSSAAAAQATSCVTFSPESPRNIVDIIHEIHTEIILSH